MQCSVECGKRGVRYSLHCRRSTGKGNGIRLRDRTRGRRSREFGRETVRGRREEGQAKCGVV